MEETCPMADMEGGDVSSGMKLNDAIKEVLRVSQLNEGLARGVREGVKALDKRQAFLCILAKNCTEATYSRLVECLCSEHQIPLLKVDDKEKLGEWVGLCKIDKDGKPRKIVKCSCVVIKNFGGESDAWTTVMDYVKTKQTAM